MGKITKIQIQKRNKNRCNIFIDEEYSFSLSNEIIYRENLSNGVIIDVNRFKEISKEDSFLKCKESALRIVEKSYKTEKELIERLKTKGYEEEAINKTINFLKEYNFINNREFSELYVKDRLRNQGSRKIKYSLINKGIDENIINEVIEGIDKEKEREVAYKLGRKKYNILIKRESDKYVIKNKLLNYLIGRGYSYDLSKRISNEVINE